MDLRSVSVGRTHVVSCLFDDMCPENHAQSTLRAHKNGSYCVWGMAKVSDVKYGVVCVDLGITADLERTEVGFCGTRAKS
jgi:hypothetical protein